MWKNPKRSKFEDCGNNKRYYLVKTKHVLTHNYKQKQCHLLKYLVDSLYNHHLILRRDHQRRRLDKTWQVESGVYDAFKRSTVVTCFPSEGERSSIIQTTLSAAKTNVHIYGSFCVIKIKSVAFFSLQTQMITMIMKNCGRFSISINLWTHISLYNNFLRSASCLCHTSSPTSGPAPEHLIPFHTVCLRNIIFHTSPLLLYCLRSGAWVGLSITFMLLVSNQHTALTAMSKWTMNLVSENRPNTPVWDAPQIMTPGSVFSQLRAEALRLKNNNFV